MPDPVTQPILEQALENICTEYEGLGDAKALAAWILNLCINPVGGEAAVETTTRIATRDLVARLRQCNQNLKQVIQSLTAGDETE